MEHYYHTKDSAFTVRTAKRGKGYYMRGTYCRRPDELRDKVEVNSTMESLGYKGGGYFGTKAEAKLNIKPFRMYIEQPRKTHSTSDGGSSSASHRKVYLAATSKKIFRSNNDQVASNM